MQKIGLVGAPTSGKTELAQQLQAELFKNHYVTVVDDYIAAIEDRSDTKLGHFASYIGNLQVAIGRWEAERLAARDRQPDWMITCGTVVETIVYNGVQALIQNSADTGKLSVRTLQNDKRSSVSMTMLGIIGNDICDYDYLFYLPLSESEVPDEVAIIDGHITEGAEAMNLPLITLSNDRKERLAEVLEKINEKTDG